MGVALTELLQQMGALGLSFRRTASGVEFVGSTYRLTPELKQAATDNRDAILAMLPANVLQESAATNAEAIRDMLDQFHAWMRQNAPWAGEQFLQGIDRELAAVVDKQEPALMASTVERLKDKVLAVNWAAEAFPFAYEAEAKHAVAAGLMANPDGDCDGDIPF